MKQKYTISRNREANTLTIREYAELEKEILTLLCEQTYDDSIIEATSVEGKTKLIPVLRNQNLYPISDYMEKIAESVISLYDPENDQPESRVEELIFDDIEHLAKEIATDTIVHEIEDETSEIDDLLDEDDIEDVFDEKDGIKNLNSSLKIANDDSISDGEDA